MAKVGLDDAFAAGTTPEELEGGATKEPPGDEGERKSQATLLVAIARSDEAELFHDQDGEPYISFARQQHRETHRLRSKSTRDWLSAAFYAQYRAAPGSQALQDALNALSGTARFDGDCHPVYVRRAGHEGAIYLDLGDDGWQVVMATGAGWSIINAADAPVRFRRPKGLRALPTPVPGGNMDELHKLINVKDHDAFVLIVAWLLGALRPTGPYPILVFFGEQGTAKSTSARILRALIDPHAAPLRAEPQDETDLLIAAVNGLIVAFDNLSRISDRFSDAICRLATGGAISKRELYSDAEEVFLDAQRPVLITGIETVVTCGDAVDRSIIVELGQIPDDQRRTETAIWTEFDAASPALLGALLDAASMALRNEGTRHLSETPRLADFATWVEAGEQAFGWESGRFLTAYRKNRSGADEVALDALPVGSVLRDFMTERKVDWEGTATQLLTVLTERAGDVSRDRGWPKKPHTLSGHLTRLAPNLRRLGISIAKDRQAGGKQRTVTINYRPENRDDTEVSQASQRHNPSMEAESSVTPLNGRASRSEPQASQNPIEASQPTQQNTRNGEEHGAARDACDTCDALSAPLHQAGLPSSNGAVAPGDPWKSAMRHRP
jgi:hypothetical protein